MKYPDFVAKPIKCCGALLPAPNNTSIRTRYSLEVSFKNCRGDNRFSVIMMNPSKANSRESDASVNRVLKYIYKKHPEVKYVTILNVLPFYSTNNRKLENIINELIQYKGEKYLNNIIQDNIVTIKSRSKGSNKIILAWGKPANFSLYYYYKLISDIINYLENKNNIYSFILKKKVLEYFITLTGDPGHPSYAKILGIQKIEVDSLYGVFE